MERRLSSLPAVPSPVAGLEAIETRLANTARSRLFGLAGNVTPSQRLALMLVGTRSVHTFGMRFELDLVWIGADGRIERIDRSVPGGKPATESQAAMG